MAKEELLEIETVTTLRGALAERLVKRATEAGKTPVGLMADIVEQSLMAKQLPGGRRRNGRREILADAEVKALRNEIAALRSGREWAKINISANVRQTLNREAARRGADPEVLLALLVETIATDNLFAAVLDLD